MTLKLTKRMLFHMTDQYVNDTPNNFRTDLGASIFRSKYAISPDETWLQRANTIVDDVCGTRGGTTHPLLSKDDRRELVNLIHKFVFLPGGRYIYYAGRGVSFYNNCFLYKGEEDTREEWGRILHSASDALMSGGGIGIDYSVFREKGALLKRTGGVASGPLPLACSVNEIGRNVRQGGSRRSAIYGSLNWRHGDAKEWLYAKDWANMVIPGTTTTFAEAKKNNFDASAPLDFTNISLNYDNQLLSEILGYEATSEQGRNVVKSQTRWGKLIESAPLPDTFLRNVKMAMYNGEPGFSFNFYEQEQSTLRNACVPGDTLILTSFGYKTIAECVGNPTVVWNGSEWSTVVPFSTGVNDLVKVTLSDGTSLTCTEYHEFVVAGGVKVQAVDLNIGDRLEKFSMPIVRTGEFYDISQGVDGYSQGFYSGDGNADLEFSWLYAPKYMCQSRLIGSFSDEHSSSARKTWRHGYMLSKTWVPINGALKFKLEWLAGLMDADGVVTRDKNGNGLQIVSTNKQFLRDVRLMLTTMGVMAKVVAGYDESIRALPDGKGGSKGYLCRATERLLIGNTDTYNLMKLGLKCSRLVIHSNPPQRDARRFIKVVSVESLGLSSETYCFNEPKNHCGTFNGIVTGQCTEVTSEDDSDMCNIGSVNMAACKDIEVFKTAVELGSKFLICGTIRGVLPDEKTRLVREKNRRIGLGLMGIHEWLLQRSYRYEVNEELRQWLKVYSQNGEAAARDHCDRFYLNHPVAFRSIAPTGTIGTIAGTTTGCEPIFAVAYKRRYIDGNRDTGKEVRKYQYYIDSAAKDLMERYSIDASKIESALDLAKDPERRIAFQADLQDYVDMAISSTLNLPEWGSETNNEGEVVKFARVIAKYAPRLRGLTMYPDGSRGGQPLVSVSVEEAKAAGIGVVYEENSDNACKSGVCGI